MQCRSLSIAVAFRNVSFPLIVQLFHRKLTSKQASCPPQNSGSNSCSAPRNIHICTLFLPVKTEIPQIVLLGLHCYKTSWLSEGYVVVACRISFRITTFCSFCLASSVLLLHRQADIDALTLLWVESDEISWFSSVTTSCTRSHHYSTTVPVLLTPLIHTYKSRRTRKYTHITPQSLP